jgi:hypothetical protein
MTRTAHALPPLTGRDGGSSSERADPNCGNRLVARFRGPESFRHGRLEDARMHRPETCTCNCGFTTPPELADRALEELRKVIVHRCRRPARPERARGLCAITN